MTDLDKKQSFWAEQLPVFKENYICLAQLEAVEFNSETGNFDALTKDATGFDLEDILEAYHSVNTGWSMWLRAKAQAVPETHIVVPRTREVVVAIEKMVEQQVEASGITSDVFRLDGWRILDAIQEASESGAEG